MATANCLFNMELLFHPYKNCIFIVHKKWRTVLDLCRGLDGHAVFDCIDLIKKKIQLGKYSNFKAHIYEIFLYSIILYS